MGNARAPESNRSEIGCLPRMAGVLAKDPSAQRAIVPFAEPAVEILPHLPGSVSQRFALKLAAV